MQFWCSDLRDLNKYRVIFGYGPLGIKKLTVLEAGDGDLTEMSQHLPSDAVAFCFMQVGCLQMHRLSRDMCVDAVRWDLIPGGTPLIPAAGTGGREDFYLHPVDSRDS